MDQNIWLCGIYSISLLSSFKSSIFFRNHFHSFSPTHFSFTIHPILLPFLIYPHPSPLNPSPYSLLFHHPSHPSPLLHLSPSLPIKSFSPNHFSFTIHPILLPFFIYPYPSPLNPSQISICFHPSPIFLFLHLFPFNSTPLLHLSLSLVPTHQILLSYSNCPHPS